MNFDENIDSANPQLDDKQSKMARNYENNLKAGDDENRRLIEKPVSIDEGKNDIETTDEDKKNDNGGRLYAWLVAICSFLCNGVIFGTINSYGTIYVALKNLYDEEKMENSAMKASLVGSLLIGLTFIMSPFASILSDRLGIRKVAFIGGCVATAGIFISTFITSHFVGLCLTFGIMFGSGFALVFTTSTVILCHYFTSSNGFVNGFVQCGSTLFGLAFPHFFKFLFDQIGISNAFRVLAGLSTIMIASSLVFKPTLDLPKTSFNLTIWKNNNYLVWIIASAIALLGHFVPYVHIVAYTEEILPEKSGETLLTCIALSNGVGKMMFGKIADCPKINPITLQQFAFLSVGAITMLIRTAPYFGEYAYASLIVFSLLFGIFDGCWPPLFQPTCVYIFGAKDANQPVGFVLGTVAIPITLGPFIAGVLYEQLQSYFTIFILAGCPPILGAIVMCLIYLKKKEKTPSIV